MRVRHHDKLARIEVDTGDLPLMLAHSVEIAHALHDLGYSYVTVDLDGYRTGSLNEAHQ